MSDEASVMEVEQRALAKVLTQVPTITNIKGSSMTKRGEIQQ